jgi:hypothetical protein
VNTFVGEFKRTLVAPYTRRQGSESLFGGGRTIGKRHDIDAEILAHYEEGIEKERLLGEGAGRLEYLRTRELLARYLPPPAAAVLDVGGGAGAYALPLAIMEGTRSTWSIRYRYTPNRRLRRRLPRRQLRS